MSAECRCIGVESRCPGAALTARGVATHLVGGSDMTEDTHDAAMRSFWAKQTGKLEAACALIALVRSAVIAESGNAIDPIALTLSDADDALADAIALLEEREAGR